MGRSNSRRRKEKAARRDFSNRRLPTFQSSMNSYIDQMVGFVEPTQMFEGDVYEPERVSSRTQTNPVPQPTPNLLKFNAFPVGVSLSPKKAKPMTQETTAGVSLDPEINECVRRASREEVLHAFKKTGKTGQKSPKWTKKSEIKC